MSGFERRTISGRVRALVSTDLERVGYLAAFVERGGGRSPPPFDSLNGSFGVGDAPELVAENRGLLAQAFGLEAFPVPGFVHGTRLMPAGRGRIEDGYRTAPRAFATADGLHTKSRGMPLGAYSADCVIAIMA
ncbi:MAG TPA: laccase domain-containing protein, partial [Longimicrobiales bacterium]|nr:laccase domain-containing protein [Longimicrobiales bacterium]